MLIFIFRLPAHNNVLMHGAVTVVGKTMPGQLSWNQHTFLIFILVNATIIFVYPNDGFDQRAEKWENDFQISPLIDLVFVNAGLSIASVCGR